MCEEAATQLPGGQHLCLEDMHICTLHRPLHACTLTDRPAPQCFPVHLAVFHEMLRLWPGVPKNVCLVLHDNMLPTLGYHPHAQGLLSPVERLVHDAQPRRKPPLLPRPPPPPC